MKNFKKIIISILLSSMLVTAGCGSSPAAPTVTPKAENTPSAPAKQDNVPVTEGAAETPVAEQTPEAANTPEVTKALEESNTPEITKTPENTATPAVTNAPSAEGPKEPPVASPTPAEEVTATPVPEKQEEKKEYVIPYGINWQDSEAALKNYAIDHNLEFVSADEASGSITVKLTETEKEQFVKTYRKELIEGFGKYPENPECEGLAGFTVSDDFSEINVYSENSSMTDGCFTAVLSGLLSVLADAEFNNVPCTSVISLYNNDSGECIYRVDFKNMSGTAEEIREKVLSDLLTIAITQELLNNSQKTPDEVIFADPESDSIKVRLEAYTDTLLLDNEQALIKISPLKTAPDNEMTSALYIENRTEEALTYTLIYSAVNSLCVEDSGLRVKLNPGESKWETVSWEIDPFAYSDVTKLQIGISAYNDMYDSAFYKKFVCLLVDEEKTYNFTHSAGLGETVVLDNKYVYVVASDIEVGEYYSYVTYYAYNKTGVDISLNATWSVVDNFMCAVSGSADVPAGIGVIDYFFWNTDDFANRGISYPAEIEISLEGDIMSNYENLFEEQFELFPQGIGVLPFDGFELPEGAILLEDNDKVTIYVTGAQSDDTYYGLLTGLYIVNKTNDDLLFTIDDAIINQEISVNAGLYSRVNAGKKTITAVYVFKDEFDEKNIDEVETFAMSLLAAKADRTGSDNIFEGTYAIKFK